MIKTTLVNKARDRERGGREKRKAKAGHQAPWAIVCSVATQVLGVCQLGVKDPGD